jgi:hypothetical protein
MLISGPRQPGNDINVFLEPLMEDMQKLWEEGVKMTDASLKEFTLKAIILVTITDYPSLFSLSGQIKGKTGYVVCIDGTCYTYLGASKKLVYMRHRRCLPKKHRYWHPSMNPYFDNQDEPQTKPKRTGYGQKVFDMVKGINIEFRKKKKEEEDGSKKPRKKGKCDATEKEAEPAPALVPFKKQSCFFKFLSYWKELDTPHAINYMHLEKNVFESTIRVLLDIKTKMKDGLKLCLVLLN